MASRISWHGIDGAGYYYGFYREDGRQWQIDIAVPGKGLEPHKGPDHKIYIEGRKVGSMPTLKGASAFADLYFSEGHHRVRERTQPKPAQAQSQAPQQQPEVRNRQRSLRDALEAYLGGSRKPPQGRSR